MKQLDVKLRNCHGIRELTHRIDFQGRRAVAIYAPNGTMKTSFARTFLDLSTDTDSRDDVFPDRTTERTILDERNQPIVGDNVVVVLSYNEDLGPSESTSTLLVNAELRREYEQLQEDLLSKRDELVTALRSQASTRQDVASRVSLTFTRRPGEFFAALRRIEEELREQETAPFAEVPYDVIFNDKVLQLLRTTDFETALGEYVTRLNELLDGSRFFDRRSFNYYNAATVTKSLGDNGFFTAKHKLLLTGSDGEPVEIANANATELTRIVDEEKQRISDDPVLSKKLTGIEKALNRNAEVRTFWRYVSEHEELLPELEKIDYFEEQLWKSYLKTHQPLVEAVVTAFRTAEERKRQIEHQAAAERTRWERVIEVFNERFFVPFRLTAKNRDQVVLGQEPVLQLGFEFEDGTERAVLERGDLLEVLSNGEKKALYILNVLFEVEARRYSPETTLFVIDDIADSFDYRNKYAIVHYLKEMSEQANFRLLLLTHNFDFFRTLQGRQVIGYSTALLAQRNQERTTLTRAANIRNPFLKSLKPHFFDDGLKRIAAIPFVRNIAEYTKGETDPDYLMLTSLLHWKSDTSKITQVDLDTAYLHVFDDTGAWADPEQTVVALLFDLADKALVADDGMNFENKIVLSIAVRLRAEQHMIDLLDEPEFTEGITANQTQALLSQCRKNGVATAEALRVLDNVALMTPENLHVNSFMYEPIIDMSDAHLRKLYRDLLAIGTETSAS